MNRKSVIAGACLGLVLVGQACGRTTPGTSEAGKTPTLTQTAPATATLISMATATTVPVVATPGPPDLEQTFTGHTGYVAGVAFSPDGKQVLTGSFDHSARLWDVATGQTLRIFTGHTDEVRSVAFSPDGQQVVTAYEGAFLLLCLNTS